jgi:pSer/pThr/pTyr-binding forkhead associated (FHA) protein
MGKIAVSLDNNVLQDIPLHKERITIGRRSHNDVVLDMRAVSAEHAAIVTVLHNSFIEDLDSTNGTQVNGQVVRKHYLQHGDLIQIGKYKIAYSSEGLPVHADPAAGIANDFPDTESLVEPSEPVVSQQKGQTAIAGVVGGVPQPMPVIRVVSGPAAGKEMILTKSLTTIGRPGVQVAVITRRPQGFLITHVEGYSTPLVDGVNIGTAAHPVVSGSKINLSGTELEFLLR